MTKTAENEALSKLKADLVAAGCFDHRPVGAVLSLVLHLALAAAGFFLCVRLPAWGAVPLFVLASFLFYRLGWIMHDAAHGGVFGRASADRRFAALVAGILGEFPSGWKYGHNRHHAWPNVRGRDGDQAQRWDPERRWRTWPGAFLALFFFSRYKGLPIPNSLIFLGLRDGVYCWRTSPTTFRAELLAVLASLVGQASFFVLLAGAPGILLFLAHTSIGMFYLNTAFSGNHYDLESFSEEEAEGLGFASLQLRTTRNYAGGAWARFVFGGLEHQIEHHLFPNMPRRGFVRAEPLVRAFAASRGLPYETLPFSECIVRCVRFHLVPARSAEPAR